MLSLFRRKLEEQCRAAHWSEQLSQTPILRSRLCALGTPSSWWGMVVDEESPAEAGCWLPKPTSLPLRYHHARKEVKRFHKAVTRLAQGRCETTKPPSPQPQTCFWGLSGSLSVPVPRGGTAGIQSVGDQLLLSCSRCSRWGTSHGYRPSQPRKLLHWITSCQKNKHLASLIKDLLEQLDLWEGQLIRIFHVCCKLGSRTKDSCILCWTTLITILTPPWAGDPSPSKDPSSLSMPSEF